MPNFEPETHSTYLMVLLEDNDSWSSSSKYSGSARPSTTISTETYGTSGIMAMMPAMKAKEAYDSRWERKFEGEEAGVTRRLDTKKTPKAVLGESVIE